MKKEINPVFYLGHKCRKIEDINLQNWRVFKAAELLHHKDTPEYFESIEEGAREYTIAVCQLCSQNGWVLKNNLQKVDGRLFANFQTGWECLKYLKSILTADDFEILLSVLFQNDTERERTTALETGNDRVVSQAEEYHLEVLKYFGIIER